jgi:hypothetical protein
MAVNQHDPGGRDEQEEHDIQVMSADDKMNLAKTSVESSPVWCAHDRCSARPPGRKTNLHFKGFGGGVPQNTETAAVKPRVGSAS